MSADRTPMDPEIARLLAAGDHIGAERLILERLARDPFDPHLLSMRGDLLRRSGRAREAADILGTALALAPDDADILLSLAQTQQDLKWDHAAAANFIKHAERAHSHRVSSLNRAAACLFRAGDRDRSARLMTDAGLLPEGIGFDPQSLLQASRDGHLSHEHVFTLMRTLAQAEEPMAITLMGLAIWKTGDEAARRQVVYDLPGHLLKVRLVEEALSVYRTAVEQGLPVGDFRPRHTQSSLAASNAPLASALYARDSALFDAALLSLPLPEARAAKPAASASSDMKGALTLTADNIGCQGAVFVGAATPQSAGARYRFIYGTHADTLDQATPWTDFPPPKTGRSYQRIYRQRCDWVPTCINPSWVDAAGGALPPGSPALSIGAPFAKDRNQLNGIGAHEMLLGLSWSQPRDAPANHRPVFPIGGGVQDLRDADIFFTLGGHQLQQFGAALHFWISHVDRDAQGHFTSQWALTASPIPDAAFAGNGLHRVSLRLRSDPSDWTYTGSNPREQGERASRYRRASLDTSLREHNTATVLIYAFGQVARPPAGAVLFHDVEVHHRNYSILSPAAGTELTRFPADTRDDPQRLTEGTRGYDDRLWTSGPTPALPLEFTWKLKRPVTLTHFQINQHPYWPARDIEILFEDENGREHSAWRGNLPEGRPDRDEPPSLVRPVEAGIGAVTVTCRIHSGYRPERCGLDGIEVYGNGALFEPDGEACTFSAEVSGLAPGTAINYRIELQDGGNLIAGDMRALPLPADATPVLHTATPLVRPNDPSCYVVRANAMGLETELWAELQLPDGTRFTGAKIPLGSQPTSRHIYYAPAGFPDSPGIFRIHARNLAGDSSLQAPWPCR